MMDLLKLSKLSICVFLLTGIISKAQIDFHPEQISIADGLSNIEVNALFQDSYGFLWVGTADGLNQYDGYKFKIYKNVPGNPESLINNTILKISEDNDKNLWIATNGGVSMLNRKTNKFTNFDFEDDVINTTQQIWDLYIDSRDDVWALTLGSGIMKYNKQEYKFGKVFSDSILYNIISQNGYVGNAVENNGYLYFFGTKGLFKMGLDDYGVEKINLDFKNSPNFGEGDNISKLFFDQKNVLWIVGDQALYKLDEAQNKFEVVKNYFDNKVFWLWRLYTGIAQDFEGNVWLGKDMRGLFKFDGISNDYVQIPFGKKYENRNNIYTETITSILVDNSGIIWIGTFNNGFFKYDPAKKPFLHFTHDQANNKSISGNEIFGIEQSKLDPNKIYVGTRGAGLNIYNPETETFKKIDIKFNEDIFGGSVRAILEYNKDIYLGTWGDGLYKMDANNKVSLISKSGDSENSLSNDLVRVLKQDASGKIWIGTNQGLNIYDPSTNKLNRIYTENHFHYPQALIDFIRNKMNSGESLAEILKVTSSQNLSRKFSIEKPRDYLIVSVGEADRTDGAADYGWLEDNSGKVIWNMHDLKNFYHFDRAPKNKIAVNVIKLLPGNYTLHYKTDDSHAYGNWNAPAPADSNWWGIQLLKLNEGEAEKTNSLIAKSNKAIRISGENIRSIQVSANNIIWIGTDANGLNRWDLNKNELKVYKNDPDNKNSISNNNVQYIHEDKNGILWLATNYGLNRFDPKAEKFTVYTEEDGLPTNYVASILEDGTNNLWIATRNGLSHLTFIKDRASFVNYDSEDGLGGSDFIALVALKSTKGRLYFGGEHGLNEFEPGNINSTPPRSIITDIKISNRSISNVDDGEYLTNSIYDTKEISLPFDRNDLSFDFSALHFGRSDKNQYAHYLEGDDDNWVYDNRRFASYTNLSPGEYVFHAKGSNSDGVWDTTGTSIKITITPPWYLTTVAYIGYFFVLAGGVFGFDRFQRKRILSKERTANAIREAELRAQAAELQAKAAEAQNRAIQIENERKTKELEEARELQLSMLPKDLPNLPHLDIAVYMKTATEVGGDYYDFHVGMDGTLTVVVGDATGHGMKAGTMVTAAKTLFNSYSSNPDILFTFREMTRCIKQLQLHTISMCMTMMKIVNNKLMISSAGMPPMFLFKRESRIIEEHLLKGMPLGTMSNFPYEIKELELSKGDTILLMSDGLPELVNEDGDLYGYKRIRNKFEEIAENEPEEIVTILKNSGSQWINDNEPDDDVTFVVIKVK